MAEKVEIIAELKNLISGEMRKINADINRMESSLQAVNRVGNNNSGGIMGQVLGANLLTSAIQRGASAIVGFASDSLDAYGNFEQFQTSLTTMFHGNKREAEMLSGELVQLAKTTPFQLTEIQEATKLMIAYGSASGSVVGEMRMLGDVSSGTTQPIKDIAYLYGTVRTQGKANLVDLKQFANRGIPIFKELAKVTGIPMKKLVEGGKDVDIAFKDVEKAFKNMTSEGGQFFGMMAEQSKTLKGSISNMNDAIDQIKVGLGEAFADIAKGIVSVMTDALNNVNTQLQAFNKSRKVLNEKGLGYSVKEWFTGKDASNNMLQEDLTEVIGKADTETKQHQLKALINAQMSKLSSDYLFDRDQENMGANEEPVDLKLYQRRMALLKDADAMLSQKLSSKKTADNISESGAGSKAKDLEKLAQANKPTQININIENLVREMTNNIQQTAQETLINMAEQISRVLTGAVNDVSVLQQI